jgi:hypothetical protein
MAAKKKPMKKVATRSDGSSQRAETARQTAAKPPARQDGGRQRAIARVASKMKTPISGFFIDNETGRQVKFGNVAGFGRDAATTNPMVPDYFAGQKTGSGKTLTQFDADVRNRVSTMAFNAERRRMSKYGGNMPTGFGGPTPAQLNAEAKKKAKKKGKK